MVAWASAFHGASASCLSNFDLSFADLVVSVGNWVQCAQTDCTYGKWGPVTPLAAHQGSADPEIDAACYCSALAIGFSQG